MYTRQAFVDVHNHFSTPSKILDFSEVIDTVRARLGERGSCGLVNSNEQKYEAFVRNARGTYTNLGNAIYVPGHEVFIFKVEEIELEGRKDILVLGLEEGRHLTPGRTLEETLNEAQDNNGIIVAAHPFYRGGVGPSLEENTDLLKHFDAIEVHNGEAAFSIPFLLPKDANEKAQQFYIDVRWENPHLGCLASSDGHSFEEVGTSYTLLNMPIYSELRTAKDVVLHLRNAVRGNRDMVNLKMTNSEDAARKHAIDLVKMIVKGRLRIFRNPYGDPRARKQE